MLNFTVGPVQESKEVLEVGAQPTPYFRNQSFSKIMLENEAMMKELTFSDEESRVVFLTASGTGAMEAAVMNSFTSDDKVLLLMAEALAKRFVADMSDTSDTIYRNNCSNGRTTYQGNA